MIALLTNIGANVNSTNLAGITPLHLAARGGDESVVTCLLSLGAKINAQNHSGITPVLEAAHYRNTQIVKLLILRSASVTIFVFFLLTNSDVTNFISEPRLEEM
eukprot:c16542_g1_i1.p2 GENE.c16542_g1_i1~~c16542_g1_i1.p2  ORF type:complete len:104 (-),score=24.43 c16542_g1_i1:409-720(-)